MHIMDLCEFEELVHDIKCPLLFIFTNYYVRAVCKETIKELTDVYRKRINIIHLDVTNHGCILFENGLLGVPSMALYKGGILKTSEHGLSIRDVEDMVRRYGECDE